MNESMAAPWPGFVADWRVYLDLTGRARYFEYGGASYHLTEVAADATAFDACPGGRLVAVRLNAAALVDRLPALPVRDLLAQVETVALVRVIRIARRGRPRARGPRS